MDFATLVALLSSALSQVGLPGSTITTIIGIFGAVVSIATIILAAMPKPTPDSSPLYVRVWTGIHWLSALRSPTAVGSLPEKAAS